MKNQDLVQKIETYTYSKNEESCQTIEVLLIGVNSNIVGIENTFEPPGFNKKHLTTWMRKNYFFLSGTLFPQVPRRFQDYPDEAKRVFEDTESAFATDVMTEDGYIHVYYPDTDETAICVTWDTKYDTWSMDRVSQPIEQDNIIRQEGHAESSEFVWSSSI